MDVKPPTLYAERILLRRWTDEDRDALSRIVADPIVMQYRLSPLSRQQSDALIDETEASFDQKGFGLWAVQRLGDDRLLGFTGFGTSEFEAPFCPAVDIGWTLARDAWGKGYATEGGGAALKYAFEQLHLNEVVAHTTEANGRSRAVMGRLGMSHDPRDDFDAPWYQPGHPRRRFVLYRLSAAIWFEGKGGSGG